MLCDISPPFAQAVVTSEGTAGPVSFRRSYTLAACPLENELAPISLSLPALGTVFRSHFDQSDGKMWCPVFNLISQVASDRDCFHLLHFSFGKLSVLVPLPVCLLSLCDVDGYPFSLAFSGS